MVRRVSGTPSITTRNSTTAPSDRDRFWKVSCLYREVRGQHRSEVSSLGPSHLILLLAAALKGRTDCSRVRFRSRRVKGVSGRDTSPRTPAATSCCVRKAPRRLRTTAPRGQMAASAPASYLRVRGGPGEPGRRGQRRGRGSPPQAVGLQVQLLQLPDSRQVSDPQLLQSCSSQTQRPQAQEPPEGRGRAQAARGRSQSLSRGGG